MQVVANSIILRHFKNIDIFRLDMGNNYFGPAMDKKNSEIKLKIKDEFIKRYQTLTNRLIHKYGEIGTLKFYEDLQMAKNELHVYANKDDIYEIIMTEEDFVRDAKAYLGEIIELIEGGKAETDEQIREKKELEERKNKVYTNMPPEIERPDISLPKEQYLAELVEYRKKINAQFE